MKLDIIFKKMSGNILSCQLGLGLSLSCWNQGKLFKLLLITAAFDLLKYQIFYQEVEKEEFKNLLYNKLV